MKRFSLALLGTALAALLTACPSTQPPANEAPVIASFSVSPQAGAAPLQVNFSWNISDPDGDSLTCKIDADNNGSFEYTLNNCTSSSTRQHTYPAGGTYTARLVVSDPDGASDELTKTVTVGANRAPIIASFTRSPASGNAPLEVTFSWSVSDPDGDSLACILDVNGDGNAEFFLSPCTSGSQKHTYTASGTYTARLTVSDAGGLEAQQTATTTVGPGGGNQPPVIDAFNRDPASGTAPLAVTFSWAISDPNGDPLTCKLDVNNDGTFEHTVTGCTSSSTRQHTYNAAGSYTAKLVVSDGKGLESSKTVSVTVTSSQPNRPPVISSFAGTPASGVAPLQVTFSWAISDPDGNALTCKLDVNNDGTFEYTLSNCTSSSTQKHTYGSAGSYTAKLVVSDPANASAQQTATVTVSSPNQAPAVNSFSASPSSGTAPLTTTFSWNVSDPDGDSLTCKLDVDNNGTFEYTLDNCTSGSSQQHTYGAAGSYTARLVVSDGQKENSKTTTVTVNAPGGGGDPYNITLRFTGTLTTGQQAAFDAAAAKWEQVITQGFASTSLNIPADECADGLPAFNGSVDDILIDAAVVPIDGPGGVLGQAGPCYMRTADRLTLYGVMQFDSADLANLEANGLLDEVVFHEMGHVLGIGTLWNYGRSLLTGATGPDPRFVGANAVREWQALGGSGNVPVENTGGAGTRDGHWRESVFDNEVMTGYLNSGANPLSRLTIGSLQDLGYTVNYGAADPYSLPGLKASSAAKTPLNIILIKPKGSIP